MLFPSILRLKSKTCKVKGDELATQLVKKVKPGAFEKKVIDSALRKLKICEVKREKQVTQPAKGAISGAFEKQLIDSALQDLHNVKRKKQVDPPINIDLTHPVEIIDNALEKSQIHKTEIAKQVTQPMKPTVETITKKIKIEKDLTNLYENVCADRMFDLVIKKEKENVSLI